MAFAKKMMGFPADLVLLSTKLPSKRHEKVHVTFFIFVAYIFGDDQEFMMYPVKNVTQIFSCFFDGILVENETKSDGNPIIFLANAMEIPRLELLQNPCHV